MTVKNGSAHSCLVVDEDQVNIVTVPIILVSSATVVQTRVRKSSIPADFCQPHWTLSHREKKRKHNKNSVK